MLPLLCLVFFLGNALNETCYGQKKLICLQDCSIHLTPKSRNPQHNPSHDDLQFWSLPNSWSYFQCYNSVLYKVDEKTLV